jgi:hypothetical protein
LGGAVRPAEEETLPEVAKRRYQAVGQQQAHRFLLPAGEARLVRDEQKEEEEEESSCLTDFLFSCCCCCLCCVALCCAIDLLLLFSYSVALQAGKVVIRSQTKSRLASWGPTKKTKKQSTHKEQEEKEESRTKEEGQ